MNIDKVLKHKQLKDGDRLLIHDEIYKVCDGLVIEKSVQLIGLGNNALFVHQNCIQDGGTLFELPIGTDRKNVTFENISITASNKHDLFENASCIFIADGNYNKVDIKKCRFDKVPIIAIQNDTSSTLNVIDCIFDDV